MTVKSGSEALCNMLTGSKILGKYALVSMVARNSKAKQFHIKFVLKTIQHESQL